MNYLTLRVCDAPRTIPFELPLTIEPFVIPTPKK
jgi:hypothetical protein